MGFAETYRNRRRGSEWFLFFQPLLGGRSEPRNSEICWRLQGPLWRVPDALAGLGYDSAKVLFDAIRRANSTEGSKVRDAIAATMDYPGVTGKITIDKDRNAIKPAVVLEIKDGKLQYVETINP